MRQTLILPLPPSINNAYEYRNRGKHTVIRDGRIVRGSRKVVLSRLARNWRNQAGWEIIRARKAGEITDLPTAPYRTRLRWAENDPADSDNRVKLLHDLLHAMRWTPDDSLLDGFNAGRDHSGAVVPGTCLVSVWTLRSVG